MIAVHVGLVEPEDLFTTPEDLSAASEPAIPVGDEGENVHENEATPSMPPRKKRKLAESSDSEPDRGEDNDIFFLPPRSSPKTFPVNDSISKYVSSCFYTYLKDDDFNKVMESGLKPWPNELNISLNFAQQMFSDVTCCSVMFSRVGGQMG